MITGRVSLGPGKRVEGKPLSEIDFGQLWRDMAYREGHRKKPPVMVRDTFDCHMSGDNRKKNNEAILTLLRKSGPVNQIDIGKRIGLPDGSISGYMIRLLNDGKVEKVPSIHSRNVPWRIKADQSEGVTNG